MRRAASRPLLHLLLALAVVAWGTSPCLYAASLSSLFAGESDGVATLADAESELPPCCRMGGACRTHGAANLQDVDGAERPSRTPRPGSPDCPLCSKRAGDRLHVESDARPDLPERTLVATLDVFCQAALLENDPTREALARARSAQADPPPAAHPQGIPGALHTTLAVLR